MYPTPDTRQFSFGTLETVMEGAYRPGHSTAWLRWSAASLTGQADKAYFGEKDFQQLALSEPWLPS
jgi:pantoate--beta-alanine ligase